MRNNQLTKTINAVLIGVFLLVFGCVPPPNNLSKSGMPNLVSPFQNLNQRPRIKSTSYSSRVKNNKPYTGPISLKIDTGLLNKQAPRKVFTIKSSSQPFSIKAVPAGPVVFQETFNKGTGTFEQTREFTVSDTSKRYSLHIDSKGIPSMRININGFDWIQPKDFKGKKRTEITKDKLLLNPNNSIRITLNGGNNGQVTVTVVEGGSAGIIRRNNGPLNEHQTQHQHTKKNDTNIFDPSDPSSIGDFEPHIGQITEFLNGEEIEVGGTISNGVPTNIVVGRLELILEKPVDSNLLQVILDKYHAQLIVSREVLNFYYAVIELDIEKNSVMNLEENIKALNANVISDGLREATFSSVNTLKTVSVALDIANNHKDIIKGVSFEQPDNRDAAIVTVENDPVNPIGGTELGDSEKSPQHSTSTWWLSQSSTNVVEAWQYSVGDPDTVIAIIDSEFGYPEISKDFGFGYINEQDEVISGTKEFKSKGKHRFAKPKANDEQGNPVGEFDYFILDGIDDRLEILPGNPDAGAGGTISEDSDFPILNSAPGHGQRVVGIIGADIDNKAGIAGVAPRSKLMLFTSTGGGSLSRAFKQLVNIKKEVLAGQKIRVVNISLGELVSELKILPGGINLDVQNTANVIKELDQLGTVVVASAGNDGINLDNPLNEKLIKINNIPTPISYVPADIPGVISVGAYQQNSPGQFGKAIFRNIPGNSLNASNSGSKVDIWAPGKDMVVLQQIKESKQVFDGFFDRYREKMVRVAGTSFAAPVVTGIVALLKSWNPNLSSDQIVSILRSTGKPLSDPSLSNSNAIGINAFEAIKHHLVNAKKSLSISGLLKNNAENLEAENATYSVLPKVEHYKDRSSVSAIGWTSNERSELNANELLLLKVSLAPPSGLVADNITEDSFKVSWNPLSEAIGYNVYISSNKINTNIINNSNFTFSGLGSGTSYLVQVSAVDSFGSETALSTPLLVETLTPGGGGNCNPGDKEYDYIGTDTSWTYIAGADTGNAVIVTDALPFLASTFKIDPVKSAGPIWASNTPSTPESFVFFKNYVLPEGYRVVEASINVQVDDFAEFSISGFTVGTATYSETFAKFNAKQLPSVPEPNGIDTDDANNIYTLDDKDSNGKIILDKMFPMGSQNALKFSFLGTNSVPAGAAVVARYNITRECQ